MARDDLPADPAARHETLVDVFGRYVMWLRDSSMQATRDLGESADSREKVRAVSREPWEELAKLSPDERAVVYDVAQATMDRFMQQLLAMLANQGTDQQLGNHHSVRFKIDLEICDVETAEVVESETINRGGRKYFGDYWGRWINRLGNGNT